MKKKEKESRYCTIYLIRHGETTGNVNRILMGHTDSPLTPKGKEQARSVAHTLKNVHIDVIYSSDLGRTQETAKIISGHKDVLIVTSQMVREKYYGVHDGKPVEEYLEKFKETRHILDALSEEEREGFTFPDNVENDVDVGKRVEAFLKEIALKNIGKTVLVVSHGSAIRNFLIYIKHVQRKDLYHMAISNGAMCKLLCNGTDFIVKEVTGLNKIK